MEATEMLALFSACVEDYHRTDHVDTPLSNPHPAGSLEALLYHKNWIDTIQWHLEDIIRDPQISPEKALEIKRRIDASNQERTDMVEQIDDLYMAQFASVKKQANARLNTESIAWAIDRLSILALKLYHMNAEATRADISDELLHKNKIKAEVLAEQKEDLCLSIDQLLEDLYAGVRIMKVYRQMKMYNDPELNPVLYKNKA
jgi:hypothetical protein